MDRKILTRILCGILALILLLSLLPLVASAEAMTYVMDVSEMEDKPKGTWKNGDTFKCGTENYFTVFCSETTRIDGSGKSFSDGYRSTKRLNFNSGTQFGDQILNAVQIKTTSPAQVTLWWVSGGDGREVAIFDQQGNVLQQSREGSVKNQPYIARFSLDTPDTYYIANIGGNNNYVRIEVTEENPVKPEPREDWDKVSAPQITAVKDTGDGKLEVTVQAVVGSKGGDMVEVTMVNPAGSVFETASSVLEKNTHTLIFTPKQSGTYAFQAVLKRDGEADKPAAQDKIGEFTLPLAAPVLASATSKGNGTVELVFTASPEAEGYQILMDGRALETIADTTYLAQGLTVGQKYRFQVVAVRGQNRAASNELTVTATQDEKAAWGFTHYGPSTNEENNGYIGSVNEEGFVTVYSENGRGKIVPASVDGLSFYYSAVPTEYNFTLRAKVTVDAWTYSNGQEGFGLMAADRLGVSGDSGNFWNNQYMAAATKIEYRYEAGEETGKINHVSGSGTKYTMKLGLGTIAKTGVTPENLPAFEANDTNAITTQFVSRVEALECAAGYWEQDGGTYNVIGNCTNEVTGSLENALLTEFDLEIQKNNTGYFITYYGPDGEVLYRRKYYDPDALNQLDSDYVYVGFFAARNARATFSDIQFSTILASEDAPAEEKPVTKVTPTLAILSPTVTTSQSYELVLYANVAGALDVTVDGKSLEGVPVIQGEGRYSLALTLPEYGENRIQVRFLPDESQNLEPDTVLENTDPVTVETVVACNRPMHHRKTIYVSPTGAANGDGTREHPFDIQTAVNQVCAGQTIVLLEGTYKLRAALRVQRGMDGTEEAPIRMIADPLGDSRPVLDFQGLSAGIVHGGDWWYFAGFDVTNTEATQKGFQVSGSHNVLDQIHAYRNGSTGIQISRYSGYDLPEQWPSHNRILNCDSYLNVDPGEEDADGFAAKLTCGEGNVFDGCVAYMNADDGWDLYAKVETGSIGAVTIRNCVAYQNGIREDGTPGKGNGNGFKLGGESLSGKHTLQNSYAFLNKSKGIDSNSCPDVVVTNCVSYNNGTYNVALYTNNAANTDFRVTGVRSFKDETCPYEGSLTMGDNLKPKGSQSEDSYISEYNYYWNGKECANDQGTVLKAEQFQSLTFAGYRRNEDGTLDLQGFLAAKNTSPWLCGTASGDMTTLPADESCTYDGTWYSLDREYHWQLCQCGGRGHYGAHELKWVVDQKPTQDTVGKKHQECTVCGYKGVVMDMQYGEELEGLVEEAPRGSSAGVWVSTGLAVLAAAGCTVLVLKKKK